MRKACRWASRLVLGVMTVVVSTYTWAPAWGLTISCKPGPILVPAESTACEATPSIGDVITLGDPAMDPDALCGWAGTPPPLPGLATTSVGVHCVVGAEVVETICPVTVVDINPPTIVCSEVSVACGGSSGSPPSGASACWDVQTLCRIGDGSPWEQPFPPAEDTTYTCTAKILGRSEDLVNVAQCAASILVAPEEFSLMVDPLPHPIPLWPPNHKYSDHSVVNCVGSVYLVNSCTGERTQLDKTVLPVSVTRITSSEPEDDRLDSGGEWGDGRTCQDARIGSGQSFQLRRERNGQGDGRTYTVYFDLTYPDLGLATQSQCVYTVAHSVNRPSAPAAECRFCVGGGCGTCPGPDPACGP